MGEDHADSDPSLAPTCTTFAPCERFTQRADYHRRNAPSLSRSTVERGAGLDDDEEMADPEGWSGECAA